VNPGIDFNHFDYIIAMDEQNMRDLKNMAKKKEHLDKLHMMTDFSKEYNYRSVPDPYYGGEEGFELVLDLLEDSCRGLVEYISENGQAGKK
jgi:protein-tyrosine phosphatase